MAGASRVGERIAKRLARAGLCSRREAERWISEGRVAVDGRVLASAAILVGEDSRITVDGRAIPSPERTRLWRYHKPRGLVTSHRDPQHRATVFDHLPRALPRVVSAGRLDLDSEGLLLLTTDGALARTLESPSSRWLRRYRVRVFGEVDEGRLARLAAGVTVDGVDYGPIVATLDRRLGRNAWLTLSLAEGRNREVRRVLGHLGLEVNRLIRTAFGPFQLGRLKPGEVAEVPAKAMARELGLEPAAAAGPGHAHRRR